MISRSYRTRNDRFRATRSHSELRALDDQFGPGKLLRCLRLPSPRCDLVDARSLQQCVRRNSRRIEFAMKQTLVQQITPRGVAHINVYSSWFWRNKSIKIASQTRKEPKKIKLRRKNQLSCNLQKKVLVNHRLILCLIGKKILSFLGLLKNEFFFSVR